MFPVPALVTAATVTGDSAFCAIFAQAKSNLWPLFWLLKTQFLTLVGVFMKIIQLDIFSGRLALASIRVFISSSWLASVIIQERKCVFLRKRRTKIGGPYPAHISSEED